MRKILILVLAIFGLSNSAKAQDIPGGVEILNKTIIGDKQDRQEVIFMLPANVKYMEVRTKETPPDATRNHADLFVKHGSKPIINDDPFSGKNDVDEESKSNNREQDVCKFTNPKEGEWHVTLYNYNGGYYFSNLVVTIVK